MSTTTALPSPRSPWPPPPGYQCARSTTPRDVPVVTPASVGQVPNQFFSANGPPTPSYFGLVVERSNPFESKGKTPWDPTSHLASETAETTQNFSGSTGFFSHHRSSSSFEKQTQARRDLDRKLEENRANQSPGFPFSTNPVWNKQPPQPQSQPNPQAPSQQNPLDLKLPPHVIDKRNNIAAAAKTVQSSSPPRQPYRLSQSNVHLVRSAQRPDATPPSSGANGIAMLACRACMVLVKTSPEDTLFLDMRPYPQFVNGRIKGALNLCIPTTLLKRQTFNLDKLQDTLVKQEEKERFGRWKQCLRIVAYDSSTGTLKDATSLIYLLRKFTTQGFSGETLVLLGGFSGFAAEYPDLVDTSQVSDSAKQGERSNPMRLTLPENASIAGGCAIPKSCPTVVPFFSTIRQNIELANGVGQMPIKAPVSVSQEALTSLPQWLRAILNDEGRSASEKFFKIEQAEQKRMQEALSDNTSYHTDVPSKGIRIAGIEKGNKNRYTNIYPYDHSRVRLQQASADHCDYVNASYVQASRSNKQYIATQAPIPTTFNDFWRLVWEQNVAVIVMLTAEKEGFQVKCHPYWNSGNYGPTTVQVLSERCIHLAPASKPRGSLTRRSSISMRRTSSASTRDNHFSPGGDPGSADVIVRHLSLQHVAFPFHPMREVVQLQFAGWPDFGIPAAPQHLIRLIDECSRVFHQIDRQGYPSSPSQPTSDQGPNPRRVVVHCSAGCGRTGTFCTVDSVIDMIKKQRKAAHTGEKPQDSWLHDDQIDLVAETVEDFRRQRLSMVQNLQQFVLCYETVLEWIFSNPDKNAPSQQQVITSP